MDNIVYITNLYDIYGDLLTIKEKKYFNDYYFDNLSLKEIADNYEVSRNAVHKSLKISLEKLENYENILKINSNNNKLKKLLENNDIKKLKDEIKNMISN